MKEITLKTVSITLPRTADPTMRIALEKAEETIRENNRLIEETLNKIIKEINDNANDNDNG
jgi:hypothetical protein